MRWGTELPLGRYACGCPVESSVGRSGIVRPVPCCIRHGEPLGLGTRVLRRLRALARWSPAA